MISLNSTVPKKFFFLIAIKIARVLSALYSFCLKFPWENVHDIMIMKTTELLSYFFQDDEMTLNIKCIFQHNALAQENCATDVLGPWAQVIPWRDTQNTAKSKGKGKWG